MGTVIAGGLMAVVSIYFLFSGKWVVGFRRGMDWRPDFTIIRELFRFGIPTGLQGVAMNVGGVMLLAYIGSLPQSGEAQAAYVIPNAGIGPHPGMRMTFRVMLSAVSMMPRRSGVCASPAERSAPPTMK